MRSAADTGRGSPEPVSVASTRRDEQVAEPGDTLVAAGQVDAHKPNEGSAFACAGAATGDPIACLPGAFEWIGLLAAVPSADEIVASVVTGVGDDHGHLRTTCTSTTRRPRPGRAWATAATTRAARSA
jgi:hypothetical protein